MYNLFQFHYYTQRIHSFSLEKNVEERKKCDEVESDKKMFNIGEKIQTNIHQIGID